MRKPIIAGNWKMNLSLAEAGNLTKSLLEGDWSGDREVYIFPTFLQLEGIGARLEGQKDIRLGAQDGYPEASGAFTGEVSLYQLLEADVRAVIIGHSERRQIFEEPNDLIADKVDAAIEYELTPFYCCGEPLEVRELEEHESFVVEQLEKSLFHLEEEQMKQVVIAYEPVWAIGTGETATPEQAQSMHSFIRDEIEDRYSEDLASGIRILYGGSIKPHNAEELFSCKDVDGGLIGGASLQAEDFLSIIQAA